MSEAASVPFTETKAPESAERLNRGALSLIDISASTMANIGPAYSFFFGFGFLVFTAGVAAPLTILVAGIAIAFLGNTLAQFSRAQPSTGGFIAFVGKTFGGTSAVTTALLVGAGYIIAISSVFAISGGFLSDVLKYYFGWNIPWIILSVALTGAATVMTIRGVGVSTKLAGLFFAFEMIILVIVWENSAALAEETGNPRRNVPRAVYMSIILMVTGYVLFAFATVTGYGYSGSKLTEQAIPFIPVAHDVAAFLGFLAYVAGFTSTIGVLISAINSQARLIFNAGREGLLPSWIGRIHSRRRTPMNAIYLFVTIASLIIIVWAVGHLIGSHVQRGQMNALNFFVESSTMGTILVLVVYFLANLALPFYYRKYRPSEFNVVKHGVLPVLGMIAIGVPVYYLS